MIISLLFVIRLTPKKPIFTSKDVVVLFDWDKGTKKRRNENREQITEFNFRAGASNVLFVDVFDKKYFQLYIFN